MQRKKSLYDKIFYWRNNKIEFDDFQSSSSLPDFRVFQVFIAPMLDHIDKWAINKYLWNMKNKTTKLIKERIISLKIDKVTRTVVNIQLYI